MDNHNRVFGLSAAPQSEARPDNWKRFTLHGFYEVLRINRIVAAELKPLGYTRKEMTRVQLALREAVQQAIRCGHSGNTSRAVLLAYNLSSTEALLEVTVHELEIHPASSAGLNEDSYPLAPSAEFSLKRVYINWIRIAREGRRSGPGKRRQRQ